jgi:ABC-type nitrate/sulfonate/bicarbonate transport system permease component
MVVDFIEGQRDRHEGWCFRGDRRRPHGDGSGESYALTGAELLRCRTTSVWLHIWQLQSIHRPDRPHAYADLRQWRANLTETENQLHLAKQSGGVASGAVAPPSRPAGLSLSTARPTLAVRMSRRIARMSRRIARRAVSIAAVLVLLAAWEAITVIGIFPSYILPGPADVVRELPMLATAGFAGVPLSTDLLVSSVRVAFGFVGAVVVGVPIGLLMGRIKIVSKALDPILQFGRPIPPLAYIPLLVVWFGIGELPKVLLILVGTVPVIIIGTISGVRETPYLRIRLAQCLGASRLQIFTTVVLPSSLPAIFTAMKVGIGYAWTCLVAAELVAADSGLGWLIQQAGQQLRVSVLLVGIILIGLLGYSMELIIRITERLVIRGRAEV